MVINIKDLEFLNEKGVYKIKNLINNKVYIGGNLEKAFFTIYGERKDIDKLTVEY